jgi:hypothetical protein
MESSTEANRENEATPLWPAEHAEHAERGERVEPEFLTTDELRFTQIRNRRREAFFSHPPLPSFGAAGRWEGNLKLER